MEILLLALFLAIVFIVVVSFAQRSEPLAVGKAAPYFTLQNQHGDVASLPAKNKKTVIAFFPRDDTSRCITEVQDFMRLKSEFARHGWDILLVAISNVADNKAFADRHSFDLPLLADEKGKVSRIYGSIIDFWFYRFAKRTTYLISADGFVVGSYVVAEPVGHVEQLLNDIQLLGC